MNVWRARSQEVLPCQGSKEENKKLTWKRRNGAGSRGVLGNREMPRSAPREAHVPSARISAGRWQESRGRKVSETCDHSRVGGQPLPKKGTVVH